MATIRKRKLSDGRTSLYIDVGVNGRRYRERLGLYLIPEVTTRDKKVNAETMRKAKEIRRSIELKVASGTYGVDDNSEYMLSDLISGNPWADGTLTIIVRTIRLLRRFDIERLSDITNEKLNLLARRMFDEGYKPATVKLWQNVCRSLFKQAKRKGLVSGKLDLNPIKLTQTKREYLTVDELEQLKAVHKPHKDVEVAFLFSCATGLRFR